MRRIINFESGISVGLLVVLIGGIAYITDLKNDTVANAMSLTSVTVEQNNIKTDVKQLVITTTEIKTKLDMLLEQKREKRNAKDN